MMGGNHVISDSNAIKQDMFAHESKVLSQAQELLGGPCPKEAFIALMHEYDLLLKQVRKITSISDVQGLALKKQEMDLKHLLDHANQGFLTIGPDRKVQRQYSAACLRIFGRKIHRQDVTKLLFEGVHRERYDECLRDVFLTDSNEERQRLLAQLPTLLQLGGNDIHVEFKLISSEDPEEPVKVMVILTDITEKLNSHAKVEYLSFHDALTSLYNRAYIDNIANQLTTDQHMPLSILVADMNGLKLTNDVFGHQKGDQFLLEAAQILTSCSGEHDIVARWGGDEFMILMPRTDQEACEALVGKIHDACESAEADPVKVSFAVGTATMDHPSQSLDDLFSAAEARMYKAKLLDAASVRKRMMDGMIQTLLGDVRSDEGHMGRVEAMAIRFAEKLGFSKRTLDLRNLRLLAALHDVGNVGVPKEILHKAAPLTENDWETVQQHSEIGYRVAQSLGENVLAEAILYMHEWWDGSGYPHGLKGNQIPVLSRLLMIVDVYDVLIHDQVYRRGVTHEEALEEMRALNGKQFDPELLNVFLSHAHEIIG
jgi:diguanylate cyclase (GGDEF)-like protein